MPYFVLAPDGMKYGPAEIPELQRWAMEDRLLPDSQLEDILTGQRLLAHQIPGLFPQVAAPAPYATYPRGPVVGVSAPDRIPVVAVLLNLLFCGIGAMYNRQVVKGIVILAVAIISSFFCLSWIVLILAMVDSYLIAQRINRGEQVTEWQCF